MQSKDIKQSQEHVECGINIDNISLAAERGQALLEVLEDHLGDEAGAEAEALLNAIKDQFQAITTETDSAVDASKNVTMLKIVQ